MSTKQSKKAIARVPALSQQNGLVRPTGVYLLDFFCSGI